MGSCRALHAVHVRKIIQSAAGLCSGVMAAWNLHTSSGRPCGIQHANPGVPHLCPNGTMCSCRVLAERWRVEHLMNALARALFSGSLASLLPLPSHHGVAKCLSQSACFAADRSLVSQLSRFRQCAARNPSLISLCWHRALAGLWSTMPFTRARHPSRRCLRQPQWTWARAR